MSDTLEVGPEVIFPALGVIYVSEEQLKATLRDFLKDSKYIEEPVDPRGFIVGYLVALGVPFNDAVERAEKITSPQS